ncbi:hypothetical protein G3I23_42785, partial [Streptomyces sp. SID10115]
AERVLEAAGVPADAPGVVLGSGGAAVLDEMRELLSQHRVWERFTTGPVG